MFWYLIALAIYLVVGLVVFFYLDHTTRRGGFSRSWYEYLWLTPVVMVLWLPLVIYGWKEGWTR